MKIFKIFLVLSMVITISYFSWSYHTSKSLQEKHERATLVFEGLCNSVKISWLERLYEYE